MKLTEKKLRKMVRSVINESRRISNERELEREYNKIINQNYSDSELNSRENAEVWGEILDEFRAGEIPNHDALMQSIINWTQTYSYSYR